MKRINALHIASFNGNIGDNANHNGLRRNLEEILDNNISFDEIEMREFYQSWNLRDFNSNEFIDLCNSYDLIIIGGGNFFELKWDYSYTGTTVNLSDVTLSRIKTPILFFGLGCDIGKGSNRSTIKKFDNFLEMVTDSEQFMVTVRNDGSYETIEKLYGSKYYNKVFKVADGAFFFKSDDITNPVFTDNKRKKIGINVVCDMKSIRFNEEVTYNDFVSDFAYFLNDFIKDNKEYDLIFFPHIYSDLEAISNVINKIEDQVRRYRITVAPYMSGKGSDKYIFGLYKHCEVILGMRFHSNVCAIAQNIPTIALSSYKKIHDLYSDLDLLDRVVYVNEREFEINLQNSLNETLNNKTNIKQLYEKVNRKLANKNDVFINELDRWLKMNKLFL